ncbi:MAG TPA: ABC transporter permease [Bacillota bacterium]|nr:ABC transporter permease [Bacillota bacterium]HNT02535.1 ABC transporter permease [Bacillota bacterium]HPA54142.1 ABC transporter permease [Bacillota bacterium]HPX69094.1 ABC transporter permease [Bacillota bacterium]HQA65540.1 ABC transporter permease [Bacillota bacterium]
MIMPITIRAIKKSEPGRMKAASIRIGAIILALVASSLFILLLSLNPADVYIKMIQGAFGTAYRIKETIVKAIPLVITSLGIAIAFKMQFWNIGGEGQIAIGSFAASYFALYMNDMPMPLMLTVMILAGMLAGGLWALIPAFFKAQWGTNETIVTLMMNYIALKWVMFLQYGPWRDPKSLGFPKIANFPQNAVLPKLLGVHVGWVIALILVVVVYIFINHTKKGYEIAVIGESMNTARYAGINIKKTILIAIMLSGGLCGLVGMIQASAVNYTLSVEITGGVGYTAIITAWLAALSAPLILIVSILFAALLEGGSYIQTVFGIPQAAAEILQGIILFFVLGSEFFVRYKFVIVKKHSAIAEKGAD